MSEKSNAPGHGDEKEPKDGPRDAKPYLDMLTHSEEVFEKYQEACDKIDEQYASLARLRNSIRERQMQVFWANLETVKDVIYSRPPAPVVVPRHKVRQALPRKASEFLERCLITNEDRERNHEVYLKVRDDVAMYGRGVAWVSYKVRQGNYEYACPEHVARIDFRHEPVRKWEENGWVARRTWLTHEQGVKRFKNKKLIDQATFTAKETDTADEYTIERKFEVWEIWHKVENKVVWVTPEVETVLDIRDPHLALEGFFPCPMPAYGTCEPNSLMPVPSMLFYKDQLEEINEMTARISSLTEALRLKGFYPAGAEDVSKAIETALKSTDNRATLVPVPNLQALFAGGSKDPIVWMPVDMVAQVIQQLLELRKQLIQDVYEITGISDIMRGQTEASETATAQQIKSQYGSVRVRGRQEAMRRVCKDCIALQGEIMAEEFHPVSLKLMAQMDLPAAEEIQQQGAQLQQQVINLQTQMRQAGQQNGTPPDPKAAEQAKQQLGQLQGQIKQLSEVITFEAVIQYLKDEKLRPFVLDIETDSTIQPDEDAEKQRRAEFVQVLGGMLGQAMELVGAAPESAGFVGEIIKFGVAPYRVGRALEGEIDDFVDQMKAKANQPQPPNPEIELKKQELQLKGKEVGIKEVEANARMAEMQKQEPQPEPEGPDLEAMHRDQLNAVQERHKLDQEQFFRTQDLLVKAKTEAAKLEAQMIQSAQQASQAQSAANGEAKATEQSNKALGELMKVIAGLQEQVGAMAQTLNAPKEVIYDENGDVIGIQAAAVN